MTFMPFTVRDTVKLYNKVALYMRVQYISSRLSVQRLVHVQCNVFVPFVI